MKYELVKTTDCMTGKEIYCTKNQEAQQSWYIYKIDKNMYEMFNGDDNCGIYTSLCEAVEELERVENIIANAKCK